MEGCLHSLYIIFSAIEEVIIESLSKGYIEAKTPRKNQAKMFKGSEKTSCGDGKSEK